MSLMCNPDSPIPPRGERRPNARHAPVLFEEAIDYLRIRPGGRYLDCTLGLAGHASGIARQLGPEGHLIGFDRDEVALALAQEKLDGIRAEMGSQAPQVTLVGQAFSSIGSQVKPASIDGILADFGVSSMQLDEAERGFSFQADGVLDMRMDRRSGLTAAQVYQFGEERRSRRVARAIVHGRPIATTGQLARIVASAVRPIPGEKINPATRTFQALRIYINRELDEIKSLMEAAPKLLKPSGRLVVISFHSLEDRIAKDGLREGARQGIWEILTKKPVTAGEEEIQRNPRARSAKLRAAERLATNGLRD